MCNFFSFVTNNQSKILCFKPMDILELIRIGEIHKYDLNSHTSIMTYHNIPPHEQQSWITWEYRIYNDVLVLDLPGTSANAIEYWGRKTFEKCITKKYNKFIKTKIKKLLRSSMIEFDKLQELYCAFSNFQGFNVGELNDGQLNIGIGNSGNQNLGNFNIGDNIYGDFNSYEPYDYGAQPIYFCTKELFLTKNISFCNKTYAFNKIIDAEQYNRLEALLGCIIANITVMLRKNEVSDKHDNYSIWKKIDLELLERLFEFKCFDNVIFKRIMGFDLKTLIKEKRERNKK